jgi:hypothetical protein
VRISGISVRRSVEIGRAVLLPVALLGAIALFLREVSPHYPVERWLFWTYVKVWLWCSLFGLASLSLGNLVVGLVLPASVPLRERITYALPAGVLAFFFLLFAGGLLGLFNRYFAAALPFLALGAGGYLLAKRAKRAIRHLRAARRRSSGARPWWYFPVLLFGLAGVGMIYFAILSPRNIAYDSHFYHLGIAQQYVAEGALRKSPEGWLPAALPHLASVLYTWCLLLPGMSLFDRLCCAAHLEFVLFLFTLAGIPVLVRRLVPRARAGLSWAAIFLFPGILLYDSSLSVAADHVTAFFAVPLYLAFRRAYARLEPHDCALLAIVSAGAIMTKYQAFYLLGMPAVALAGRAVWLLAAPPVRSLARRVRRSVNAEASATTETPAETPTETPAEAPAATSTQATETPKNNDQREKEQGPAAPSIIAGLAALAALGLLLTAPHWLKNWIWYGDPLFPYLHNTFLASAWDAENHVRFADWNAWQTTHWSPQGTLRERLILSAKALAWFSFQPHDWPNFHGAVPVFGSLLTLSVLFLPFVRGAKRTWGLVIACHVGVFLWFWTMHQDRYLQIVVPWMATAVAAAVALAWRAQVLAKGLLLVLLALQAVWGGDVYFIPSHAMTHAAPTRTTGDLLALGYLKKFDARAEIWGTLFQVGRSDKLPKNARVLIHENNTCLGVWRATVMDIAGWQYELRYERLDSPGALDATVRGLGVTHILSHPSKSLRYDSLGADLRFFDYITHHATALSPFGDLMLYSLPAAPVTASANKPKSI